MHTGVDSIACAFFGCVGILLQTSTECQHITLQTLQSALTECLKVSGCVE